MKNKTAIFLLILMSGVASAAEQNGTKLDLSQSKIPTLHLTVSVPQGWIVQWYGPQEGSSLARIHREASQGRDAIVIATSDLHGKTEEEAFSAASLESFATAFSASICRREKNDFWNGAYLEYELKGAPPGFKIEVHNWLTVADGFLVQFQCYFLHDLNTAPDVRQRDDAALVQRYLEIIRTVASSRSNR